MNDLSHQEHSSRYTDKGVSREAVVINNTSHTSDIDVNTISRKPLSKQDRGLVNILFLVTASFLTFNSPQIIRVGVSYISPSSDKPHLPEWRAGKSLAFHTTNNLSNINLSVNFFLYCFSGKKFRSDLRKVLLRIYTSLNRHFNNVVDIIPFNNSS